MNISYVQPLRHFTSIARAKVNNLKDLCVVQNRFFALNININGILTRNMLYFSEIFALYFLVSSSKNLQKLNRSSNFVAPIRSKTSIQLGVPAKIKRFLKPAIIIVAGLCLVLLYYFTDPANSEWARYFPKCVWKALTGYDCPGCGLQRALHAMLTGDMKTMFWTNPFLVIFTPYFVAIFYAYISPDKFAQRIKPYLYHNITIAIFLAIYVIWWVVRNTEWWLQLAAQYQ